MFAANQKLKILEPKLKSEKWKNRNARMNLSVLALLFFILTLGHALPLVPDDFGWDPNVTYDYHVQMSPSYDLYWKFVGDEIHFQVILQQVGWIGLGFHQLGSNDEAMRNGDLYTVFWNETIEDFQFDDRWTPISSRPHTDVEQNCVNNILENSTSAFNGSQSTAMRFARKLDTGDKNCDWPIVPGPMRVLWAFGNALNSFGYHQQNAGIVTVDFFNTSATTGKDTTTGEHTTSPSTTGKHTTASSTTTGSHTSTTSTTTGGHSTTSDHVSTTGSDDHHSDEHEVSTALVVAIAIGAFAICVGVANIAIACFLKRKRAADSLSPESEPFFKKRG